MIVTAKIEKLENGKLVLKPDVDISRFLAQKRPRRVEVRLDDGRTISADQRRKIFAIIRDISLWSGQEPEELRLYKLISYNGYFDWTKSRAITEALNQKKLFTAAKVAIRVTAQRNAMKKARIAA